MLCSVKMPTPDDSFEDLIAMMRGDDMEDVPEHVLARAVRLFRQRTAMSDQARPSLLRRLMATLRFDSATMAPAFGVRAAADRATRQLLFDAQPYEIEVRTRPFDDGWNLSGQLLGPVDEVDWGQVALIGDETHLDSQLTDLFEFSLPAVPAGTYRLEIRLGELTQINIDPLEVG